MKKILCMLLAACMLFALAACGEKPAAAPETKEWTRQGYFTDDSKRMLTVLPSEEAGKPGWYVAFLDGEDWVEDAFSGTLPQEGAVLRGTLTSYGSRDDLKVTVSEDGEAGLQIALDGGETYRLTPLDTGTASIIVRINVDGWGSTDYVVGEEAPPKPEYRFTSHQINIAEPETYTFCAWQIGRAHV